MRPSTDTRSTLFQLQESISNDLVGNILPFWYRMRSGDRIIGGLDNQLNRVSNSPVSLVMVTRLLWTYSRAHRLFGDTASKDFATWVYQYLQENFLDPDNGGYFWRLNENCEVLDDKKQTYGQAYAIYALAEFHLATGSGKILGQALELMGMIEQHCWKQERGGYWEALDCSWGPMDDVRLSNKDLNAPFSMNTHLHIMEAYANLLTASRDNAVAGRLKKVFDVLKKKILHPDGNRFGLFFSENWQVLSENVSPGHDIEGSWLICEAAELLADAGLSADTHELAITMVDHVASNGLNPDGSIAVEYEPGKEKPGGTDWWPQAEGVIGFLNAFQLTGNTLYLSHCVAIWDYIKDNLIDYRYGEWLAGRKVNGEPLDSEKAGPWKSAYHNGRMGFEITQRVNAILKK